MINRINCSLYIFQLLTGSPFLQLMEAKVKKKLDKNLEVELQPSGTKALLPREHLSDSPDNQQLLWQALEPGDSVGTVMLLKQTNVTVSLLTNK